MQDQSASLAASWVRATCVVRTSMLSREGYIAQNQTPLAAFCTAHHAVPVCHDSCIEASFGCLDGCLRATDAVGALLDAAPHLLIEPVLLTLCELPCRPAEQAARCMGQCSAPPAIL